MMWLFPDQCRIVGCMKAARSAMFFALPAGVLWLAGFCPQSEPPHRSEYPSPLVREEQTVIVDGLAEVWELAWTS
jgi:hypothetical protein